MEVVLGVAFEHNYVIFRRKCDQANGAVWHVTIFVLILLVLDISQLVQVTFQLELAEFVCCLKQIGLMVAELSHDAGSPLIPV